jgi:hypothetical protein
MIYIPLSAAPVAIAPRRPRKPPAARAPAVQQALCLLDRALDLLDANDLPIAAAKIDEARWEVQRSTGNVTCLVRR